MITSKTNQSIRIRTKSLVIAIIIFAAVTGTILGIASAFDFNISSLLADP
jgi:hypothetical protein